MDSQEGQPRRKQRVRSRTRRAAAAAKSRLPTEVWTLILAHHLPPRWRFCARPVCRLWRDILAGAPTGRSVDPALGVAYANLDDERHALQETRGRLVRASVALMECPLLPGAPTTPEALVAFCLAHAGTTHDRLRGQRWLRPLDIVLALLATGTPDLIDYALGSRLNKEVNNAPRDEHDSAVRKNLTAVAGAAIKVGGMALIERVTANVPDFDFIKHCDLDDAIAADSVDAVVALTKDRHERAFCDPQWWKIIGTHDAINVMCKFIAEAIAKAGFAPGSPVVPLVLLKRMGRRYDDGPCTVIAAQAAAVHGGTRVLEFLAQWGGETILGTKDTPRANIEALVEMAAAAGNIKALAWCLERCAARGWSVDAFSVACDAVVEPHHDHHSDIHVPWDPYRAVHTVAWVRDRVANNGGGGDEAPRHAALKAGDGKRLLCEMARHSGPYHCDMRCVFGLVALFGPMTAARVEVDNGKSCRALADTFVSIACEELVARGAAAIAERLTLALEGLAADMTHVGGDATALRDAVDPWSALTRLWGHLRPSPNGLAGAMAYVLARVDGRSCAESLLEASRAARPGVAAWTQESCETDLLAPPVASTAAWQRWWRPGPVSTAHAHERDTVHRGLWGHGPGPALGDVGTLDAFLFLRARGLLLD
ncbi:F-box incomplete domain containing protein [Pandoravirus quercus]|uniref:F-box incomplete domain containing protein n=1 Tax=Pandoravirus quercus TaxID=2107709 RepID=A0A2U7UAC8_9VIRU|nr:F-box incomplete domain containing protein [Pandoravirus quercus]AVK75408.1 F-box incomplete domain containing protein [Pandoravirus quercus]